MKKSIFALCLLFISLTVFSSCSASQGLHIGFNGLLIGKLPEVHFGIKSSQTEFDLDDVTLDFSYGNGSSTDVSGCVGGVNGEECPIVCVAVYFYNAKYLDTVARFGKARFDDYKTIEGLHFVKEISLDDYNESYDVENSFWGRRYEHTETLTIPQAVFELSKGYACLGVLQIAYVPSENKYWIVGGNETALKYEMLDGHKVRLSEPGTTTYTGPQE